MAGAAPRAAIRASRGRFAVVAGRFNEPISTRLVEGALTAFRSHGLGESSVEVHWVPGSFELPLAAHALARTGRYAGVVCVGVVIRGETPHWDYVAGAAAHGIGRAALDTGLPISFGVITALTEEQAWARAGGAVGNRGEEAARATLEMAGWLRGVRAGGARPGGAGERVSRSRGARRRARKG